MSTNELTLTLVGWVATEPKHYTGAGTTPFTSFRMASTRRYFDRAQNAWVDGRTEWFTIKAWRQQAFNVAASLRKSDPVIVHGRLATEEWTGPEGPRTSLVVEALAIGPDLTFGEAKFMRTVHLTAAGQTAEQGGEPTGEQDQAIDAVAQDPWAADSAPGHDGDGDDGDGDELLADELDEDAVGIGSLNGSR